MSGATQWRQRAREALDSAEIMVLATVDADSGTWTSQVQFQAGEAFERSFLSHPGTRHGRNTEGDPRVAVSVYRWPGPDGGNLGLQVTGRASGTRSARRGVVLRLADRPRAAPHQHPLTILTEQARKESQL